jgi:broad specificity phosphatase PhoE
LSREGQQQARRIGEALRRQPIPVEQVWSSQWCRTRETADLAVPGKRLDQPVFNSFFGDVSSGAAQTSAAQALMDQWQGTGLLLVVTHQVNITALTGLVPAQGEAIVLTRREGTWGVRGRWSP